MIPQQRERVARFVRQECRAEAQGDEAAADAAADIILSTSDEATLRKLLPDAGAHEMKAMATARLINGCLAESMGDKDAALAAAKCLAETLPAEEMRQLAEEAGWKPEWMRKRERREMKKTLRRLNAALSATAPHREAIALALEDEYKRPTLAGITGPLPLFPAATEVGRFAPKPGEESDASLLTGEPEVGSIGSATGDTAKEQTGRKAARGKAKRKRSLPRRLRVKSKEQYDGGPWASYLRRQQVQ